MPDPTRPAPTDLPLFTTRPEPGRPAARALAGTPVDPDSAPAASPVGNWAHSPFHQQHPQAAPEPPSIAPVDWGTVTELRAEVSERIRGILQPGAALEAATHGDDARRLIEDAVRSYNLRQLSLGRPALGVDQQTALAKAVFDAIFGLGRIQALLDQSGLETIEIRGYDQGVCVLGDGRLEYVAHPVADNNEQLVREVQLLAAHSRGGERSFSATTPLLDLALPDGSRLSATGWVGPSPMITIRKHGLVDVDLYDLVDLNSLDEVAAQFLDAAMQAGRSAVVSGLPAAGKALALDTPIPTPKGWTTMGWLKGGDVVFDETGRPCRVTQAHPVQHGRPCYRVEFNDGTAIVADADHLWRVTDRTSRARDRDRGSRLRNRDNGRWAALSALVACDAAQPDEDLTIAQLVDHFGAVHADQVAVIARSISPSGHVLRTWNTTPSRAFHRQVRTYSLQLIGKELLRRRTCARQQRAGGTHQILTTEQMASADVWDDSRPWFRHNFQIELTGPLQYPTRDLPIDPYVLGIWLGEGSTAAAEISTADPQVLERVEAAGYPCQRIRDDRDDYAVGGSLQSQLRHLQVLGDKHIPRIYLHADRQQRMQLLWGLMDSAGTAGPKSGSCCFDNTNELLAQQVRELVTGLGYRPAWRSKTVLWKGRPVGDSYTVSWTTRDPMFLLERKCERQARCAGAPTTRSIVAITEVESVPVRCITVDSPSSLYLAGRGCVPTHNTTFMRGLLNCLHPDTAIATIESEFELHLHRMPHRHRRVWPVEARPGGGERDSRGDVIGEVTLRDLVRHSLRQNVDRIVVGEVRGDEVLEMLDAMTAGKGSLSTIHATGVPETIERIVTCALKAGAQVTTEYAYRQVATHIDLIVNLGVIDQTTRGGRKHRFLRAIGAVGLGDQQGTGLSVTSLFAPGPDGRAVPSGLLPDWIDELREFGFDPNLLTNRVSQYKAPLDVLPPAPVRYGRRRRSA